MTHQGFSSSTSMASILKPDCPDDRLLAGFDGVLFDLDGTLIDSMPLHYRAYKMVFKKRGAALSWQSFMRHVGPPAARAIPMFAAEIGENLSRDEVWQVHEDKKYALETLLEQEVPQELPAAKLLRALVPGQKSGLVTSGNSKGSRAMLAKLGWIDIFDVIVTGDDVQKGKPDPEPYLLAASKLEIAPERCVALEDTVVGIESALAAGMQVCDVNGMNSV